jgi:hypothetical protein
VLSWTALFIKPKARDLVVLDAGHNDTTTRMLHLCHPSIGRSPETPMKRRTSIAVRN